MLPATVHAPTASSASGDIVRLVGRTPNSNRVERALDAGTIPESIALVVLVDGRSASASEVFAGCIQDHRRGVLIGTRTFGKFLVQNVIDVPGPAGGRQDHERAIPDAQRSLVHPQGRHPGRDRGGAPARRRRSRCPTTTRRSSSRRAPTPTTCSGAPPRNADVAVDWVDPQLTRALELIDGNLLLQEIRGEVDGNG